MFYSTDLLRKNDGKFAAIWLAGVYGKNIKKILTWRQIAKVDISQACDDVVHPAVRFSLRLQSNLMLGILRVYREQVFHFCADINRAWRELRTALHVDMRLIDLHKQKLSVEACTFQEPGAFPVIIDDFPSDIFSMSPSQLFPMLNTSSNFISVGFASPPPSLTHTPQTSPRTPPSVPSYHSPPAGPHQTTSDKITIEEKAIPDHIDEPIQVPGVDIDEEIPMDDDEVIPPKPASAVTPPRDKIGGEIGGEIGDEEIPPEKQGVQIIDPATGKLKDADESKKTPEQERQRQDDMLTPSDSLEPIIPRRPRKRKGQPVDLYRKLNDEKIRRNISNAMDTQRDRIIDVPLRLTVQELFSNPVSSVIQNAPFIAMWRRNAVTNSRPDEDFIRDDARPSPDESAEEIEVVREDQPMDGSSIFINSVGSSINITADTPGSPASSHIDTSRRSVEEPRPPLDDNIESAIPMETIKEVEIETVPPITPIAEGSDGAEDEEDIPPSRPLRNLLTEAMGDRECMRFSELFPPCETRKSTAAKGLFELLEWHRQGVIALAQPGGKFTEINIERGRNF